MCVDNFGTAALGNGRRPERAEAEPRLSEEHQALRLDAAPSLQFHSILCACSLPAPGQVDADDITKQNWRQGQKRRACNEISIR